ncbi:group III truncated hemoglobin [Lutibacter sp. A80]|uniref:group III truncated hemoglobin n=1 Tax=Lutibacter sp. A80 TaxID=2918453 RepID=UPI001F05400A|nr:group III truncated hemoglobin [Lutibacter sp. A80]UMB61810.1 group III truncated hemoglobin [Lutibacter sp. A80]
MKKDIENRADIYLLVKTFYKKLMKDDIIGHFFVDFTNPELLELHLQTLVDFWDNILFYSGGYRKNAMAPHLKIHQQKPFKKEHFNSWLSMFNESVDALFKGEIAHTAKSRAHSIAIVMEIKISELNNE